MGSSHQGPRGQRPARVRLCSAPNHKHHHGNQPRSNGVGHWTPGVAVRTFCTPSSRGRHGPGARPLHPAIRSPPLRSAPRARRAARARHEAAVVDVQACAQERAAFRRAVGVLSEPVNSGRSRTPVARCPCRSSCASTYGSQIPKLTTKLKIRLLPVGTALGTQRRGTGRIEAPGQDR